MGLIMCKSYSKVVSGSRLHFYLSNSKFDIGSCPGMHNRSVCAHLGLWSKVVCVLDSI